MDYDTDSKTAQFDPLFDRARSAGTPQPRPQDGPRGLIGSLSYGCGFFVMAGFLLPFIGMAVLKVLVIGVYLTLALLGGTALLGAWWVWQTLRTRRAYHKSLQALHEVQSRQYGGSA